MLRENNKSGPAAGKEEGETGCDGPRVNNEEGADTCTEDTDTQIAQQTLGLWWTEWTVWTHTERHLESTDTQRPGSGWKTWVKKETL